MKHVTNKQWEDIRREEEKDKLETIRIDAWKEERENENLTKQNKYKYLMVIQQRYTDQYGWEDVSEYEVNSQYLGGEYNDWRHDVKEYRLMGYPTRTIRRRELNEVVS